MEKKAKEMISEEELSKAMISRRDQIIESQMCRERFTDEQRGLMKSFMWEIYELGKQDGKALLMASDIKERLSDPKFNEAVDKISSLFDSQKDNSKDAELYKYLYECERRIVFNLINQMEATLNVHNGKPAFTNMCCTCMN